MLQTKKRSSKLGVFLFATFIRDRGGIQTPNRWSRNPVLYSVELRGHFKFSFLHLLPAAVFKYFSRFLASANVA